MTDNQRRAALVITAWTTGRTPWPVLTDMVAAALDEAEARGRREGRDEMAQEYADGDLT